MSDSFDEIDRAYRKRLCAFLSKYTRCFADAEEIAQQTLIKAFQSLGTLRDRSKLGPWLYQIAYRLVLDETRRKKTVSLDDRPEFIDTTPNPHTILQQREERTNLWSRIRELLTPDEFTATWLRHGEDYPIEGIASIMSRSPGSVRVLLFRARNKMREGCGEFLDDSVAE